MKWIYNRKEILRKAGIELRENKTWNENTRNKVSEAYYQIRKANKYESELERNVSNWSDREWLKNTKKQLSNYRKKETTRKIKETQEFKRFNDQFNIKKRIKSIFKDDSSNRQGLDILVMNPGEEPIIDPEAIKSYY
jgi:hypothetical protein